MTDWESTADPSASPAPEANGAPAPEPTAREADLETRVRKLEAAVAEFPPGGVDEIADRVIARLSAIAAGPPALHSADRVTVLDALAIHDDAPHDTPAADPPPPKGAVLRPPAPPADPASRGWFLTRLWAELRLIARMYFDPHYRISRTTQFALPGIALVLIFNYFFFSSWVTIPVVSPVTERLLAVALGVVGYKILMWETARYREVLDYLSRYGPR
jgi:hypothetical protein